MNRIILLGNGFDLAHNLKTSYSDFLKYVEENDIEKIKSNKHDTIINGNFCTYSITKGISHFLDKLNIETLERLINNRYISKTNRNYFFKILNSHNKKFNWVDIEHFYFSELNKSSDLNQIKKLNKEFSEVRNSFEEYLRDNIMKNINKSIYSQDINNCIDEDFNIMDLKESHIKFLIEDLINIILNSVEYSDYYNLKPLLPKIKNNFIYKNENAKIHLEKEIRDILYKENIVRKNRILFLNFNYTNLETLYNEESSFAFKRINHIHGEINSINNKIIFGFGDEYGKEYNDLELKYDNEYFQNIKSFKYLETNNYRNLMEFINSEPYQISIFGHSCGHSDRTLLKTIFEHENCVSIKPFYRIKNDGTDNYFEIVGNISRNFSNKMDMRDKVVNKQYCKAFIDTSPQKKVLDNVIDN